MIEQFCDVGRGVSLCYEAFGDRSDPAALLVMGLGTQMLGWHEDFCAGLAKRGFYVVRFDNRDAGLSTHFSGPPPSISQMLTRRFSPRQYTLSDMAADAAGLLRELDLSPAHIVGASMGGMIAQMLAAEHPAHVRSLVSIMSSSGNRWRGQPALGVYRHFLKRAPSEREAFLDYAVSLFGVIGSPGYPRDVDNIRERAARSYDRRHEPDATGRQLAAILASGDRTGALRSIRAPTLVIHGAADRLVRPSGGYATARAIPDARMLVIDGMGHDLPQHAWPQILDAIAEHARRAEPVAQAA